MTKINDEQVGGDHYKRQKIQHWDYAAANEFDYFQGQITKYVSRWKTKNGVEDLHKARHFLQKYIEVVEAGGFSGGKPVLSPAELVAVSVEQDTAAAVHALVEGWHPSHQMTSDARGRYCRACGFFQQEFIIQPCPRSTPESARKVPAEHDWSNELLSKCWKCGQFKSGTKTICPETYPFKGKTEPCCECGKEYPTKDLIRDGEIYCPTCRDQENTHYLIHGKLLCGFASEHAAWTTSLGVREKPVTCSKCKALLISPQQKE